MDAQDRRRSAAFLRRARGRLLVMSLVAGLGGVLVIVVGVFFADQVVTWLGILVVVFALLAAVFYGIALPKLADRMSRDK